MASFVYVVLERAGEAATKEEKIKILRDNNSFALRTVLQGGMDSSVEFILPEGRPPFSLEESKKWGFTPSAIQRAAKKLKFFVKNGPGQSMASFKRERMFITLLETMHPEEAELLILMKDKSLIKKTGTAHYKGITKKLVIEAFPGLIKDED